MIDIKPALKDIEFLEGERKRLWERCRSLESKLCEGRNLVDMLATDIPDLAAWSSEVDKLLEELENDRDM